MIVALALGVLRVHWAWLALVCPLAVAFDYVRHSGSADWCLKSGATGCYRFDLAASTISTMALCAIAYGVGRLIRMAYDRAKRPAS